METRGSMAIEQGLFSSALLTVKFSDFTGPSFYNLGPVCFSS